MKIAILTQPLRTNYGGLLQNYALQQILKRAGHEVITLDWRNIDMPLSTRQKVARLKGKIYTFLHKKKVLRNLSFDTFKTSNINSTDVITDEADFLMLSKKYGIEAFVVGSDQCWRPRYSYPYLYEMFLSFTQNLTDVKRIAYAASFGVDKWEFSESQTRNCSELAQLFDLVSVRESSGIDLCKQYLNVNADLVLDPTLLLLESDYTKLLQKEAIPSSPGSLYYYVLDNKVEINHFIEYVSNITGYEPFFVSMVNKNIVDYPGTALAPSVYSWIKGFQDAKMIIVDSFHGMVFSIIYNKPFWVIGNKVRGMSRFESLLSLLGLEDRLIDIEKCYDVDLSKKINWQAVNSKLSLWRESSISFLLKYLANE